jgi:hypothetical protein
LHQAIFTANNIGEKPIENVRLDFFLENLAPDDFLEVILTNAEEVQEIVAGPLGQDFESFAIELPFLNPRKEYEDYLGITIYAPKPLVVKTVTGKGLGWSTKYFDRVAYRRKIETSLAAILARSTSPAIQIAVKVLNLLSR